jgi:hypothetical protein
MFFMFCIRILFFLLFCNHCIQIARAKAAVQPDSYVVRFADGSTQRYGGFVKDRVTTRQLLISVVTDKGDIHYGSVSEFDEYGPRPRLMCDGILCDHSALCESFRAGSSSGGSVGGGGAEATVAADFVFDFVCFACSVFKFCFFHIAFRLLVNVEA